MPGLFAPGDGSLEALVISHPHPDHHGLADLVDPSVPIYLGARASAILDESSFFIPWAPRFSASGRIEHRRPLALGPFTVTPWRVDHNAEDAFALLVEAGGRRVLYSGDWRGHGSNRWMIDELAAEVGPLDTLMIEGTRIGRDFGEADALLTEDDVEDECADLFALRARVPCSRSARLRASTGWTASAPPAGGRGERW